MSLCQLFIETYILSRSDCGSDYRPAGLFSFKSGTAILIVFVYDLPSLLVSSTITLALFCCNGNLVGFSELGFCKG